jgi:hypothetical protein
MKMGLAQTPFCGVCDAPQGHVRDRPTPLPHRLTGPFGKSQTPQNGVCASHDDRIFDPAAFGLWTTEEPQT